MEIDLREPWSESAAIFVENPDDKLRDKWEIKAGALDYSAYHPNYKGLYLVSGTERKLRFTRDGCLISYENPRRGCAMVTTDSTGMFTVPEK